MNETATQEVPAPVIKKLTVPVSPEKAFDIFALKIAAWWPLDKHSVSAMAGAVARDITLEPKLGGQIVETKNDGSKELWGHVTHWSPGKRLSLDWHIGRPRTEASDVTVIFAPHADGATVTLTHSRWEAFGEGAAKMREGYNNGWVHVFETCYGAAAKA